MQWGFRLIDARRSARVLAQIPIQISGEGPVCQGVTAVVNREGAMVLAAGSYHMGAVVRVQNLRSNESAQFRVIWDGGQEPGGQVKLGIEMLEERPDFWGVDWPAVAVAAKPPKPV